MSVVAKESDLNGAGHQRHLSARCLVGYKARRVTGHCANCGEPIAGISGSTARGRDTAWFAHCPPCAELSQQNLQLVDDSLNQGRVLIYQCRICGINRTCRNGWRTRCHICLDERTAPDHPVLYEAQDLLDDIRGSRFETALVRQQLALPPGAKLTITAAAAYVAAQSLNAELDRYRRPGWKNLVTDVHGLPWIGYRLQSDSHGTWGTHQECGTRQKMQLGSIDCLQCGPEPNSRTHAARAENHYFLYLVQHRHMKKFGVGDERRVREHVRAGARLLQLLSGRHADVVHAERLLKQAHRKRVLRKTQLVMLPSFGRGTEVVPARVRVDLRDVFPDGRDALILQRQ